MFNKSGALPHGIKGRLTDVQVGRIQEIYST
ncbi:DUF2196 domain-containing protein [Lysinibacillus fusiformis]